MKQLLPMASLLSDRPVDRDGRRYSLDHLGRLAVFCPAAAAVGMARSGGFEPQKTRGVAVGAIDCPETGGALVT